MLNGVWLAVFAPSQPFQEFVHLPWWEVAINPDPKADPQQFRDLLKGEQPSFI